MYGLINLAIEDAIIERYGTKFWGYIKECCIDAIGDTDGVFISRLFYDDEVTYRLIETSERILRSEKYGYVSQLFGQKFYELVQDSGYEGILRILGGTLKEFLDNLDSFHVHLSTTYSQMKAPSFRCSVNSDNNDVLTLHYYSERHGLEGIVMGMIKAAASDIYHQKIDIKIDKLKDVDQGINHTEFSIEILKDDSDEDSAIDSYDEDDIDDGFSYMDVEQLANNVNTKLISPLEFAQALPFHVIFDRNLIIRQAGTSLLRIIPVLKNNNIKLTNVMTMLEPTSLNGKLSFQNILSYINANYVFRPDIEQVIHGGHRHLHEGYLKRIKLINENNKTFIAGEKEVESNNNKNGIISNIKTNINLKEAHKGNDDYLTDEDINKYIVKLIGQMIYMQENDLMLFVCSPSVANLDDLNNTGLFLSDIPLHDATRDLVLLSEQFEAEYKVQKKLMMLTDKLNAMKVDLEEEKKKTDRLLYSVLPPTVANELRNNRPVPAKRFQSVTILFSGIVGFSEFCALNSDSSGAIRIVNLLNKIYTTFDVLTEPKRNPYVYKVETVGDKYMAVSGLPEACDSHARHISRLALDLIDLAETIKLEDFTGGNMEQKSIDETIRGDMDQCDHLRVTIGVHCGEVVTGVIGKRTPRYCLFGNTVNLTSRCETSGVKGAINVSQDVYNICMNDSNNFDSEFNFKYRGRVNMKGKTEPMEMWFLTRRKLVEKK